MFDEFPFLGTTGGICAMTKGWKLDSSIFLIMSFTTLASGFVGLIAVESSDH
jgi:hypothetical protein